MVKEVKKVTEPKVKKVKKVVEPKQDPIRTNVYIDTNSGKKRWWSKEKVRVDVTVNVNHHEQSISLVTYFDPNEDYFAEIPAIILKLKQQFQVFNELTCA